uniref:Putative secreted protein n=1 Tax=Anopheles darlingi TaxID=43151 RepID=A0A2M4D534_ANODA
MILYLCPFLLPLTYHRSEATYLSHAYSTPIGLSLSGNYLPIGCRGVACGPPLFCVIACTLLWLGRLGWTLNYDHPGNNNNDKKGLRISNHQIIELALDSNTEKLIGKTSEKHLEKAFRCGEILCLFLFFLSGKTKTTRTSSIRPSVSLLLLARV